MYSSTFIYRAMRMVALASITLGCTDPDNVSQSIRKLTRDESTKQFHLNQVARFAWDRVVFFGPYTPRAKVCATFRIPAKDCERFVPFEATDDGDMTLAFVMQDCLVAYAKHRRKDGDFLPLAPGHSVAEEDASFRIVRGGTRDGEDWVGLVQVQSGGAPVVALNKQASTQ